jgi:UDP-N-acetylmuramoyl-L-alanyl-D-glutamate--2,6-diaminopimelate ligase
LYNVIRALKPLAAGKLVVVFGCGGERDKLKRPKMGRIVSEMADYAVLTSDNPRSEDPSGIIRDILGGIRKDNYRVIEDRRKAIEWALGQTGKGDCLVIAGKGHEDYQVLKGKTTHFSDREAVLRCLRYGR